MRRRPPHRARFTTACALTPQPLQPHPPSQRRMPRTAGLIFTTVGCAMCGQAPLCSGAHPAFPCIACHNSVRARRNECKWSIPQGLRFRNSQGRIDDCPGMWRDICPTAQTSLRGAGGDRKRARTGRAKSPAARDLSVVPERKVARLSYDKRLDLRRPDMLAPSHSERFVELLDQIA